MPHLTCFYGTKVVVPQGAAFTVAAQGGAHHLTMGAALSSGINHKKGGTNINNMSMLQQ